ncbi:tyrosine-type recombinase/integrase [Peptostreptococcus canis]|uniref:Site-specific integrase n=1 Tax=Peptostreptococcus canis TaxID=1159213 RepID=A0ABR6TIF2_9FIRM|nr:site-specific integrase [Peptostreptococcus canis]MBC2575190.1 site-specific integrase [Peptostreptococcus canis]MBP1997635.1 integrase [Peptostreptococcus canis]
MGVYKDNSTGLWRVQIYYTDYKGESQRKQKKGFKTKKEAKQWESDFINSLDVTTDIIFIHLVNNYMDDLSPRLKVSTMSTKKNIIDKHILPFFKDIKVKDISPLLIRKWQNAILKEGYSNTFTKTINNQMSAILNYAVSFYGLQSNPVRKAGSIGKKKSDEMNFWTYDEYKIFISNITKPEDKIIFEILYYSGMRIGEMLALTPTDINFEEQTISINKSLSVINGITYITEPKTEKGKRIIGLPESIMNQLSSYMKTIYCLEKDNRIFTFARSYPAKLMNKYIKDTELKRIRTHDFRHSHASLLINLDINIMTIADRLGHEKVDTTWNTYGHLYPNKRVEVVDKLKSLEQTENK